MAITSFKRIEKKFIITESQKDSLIQLFHEHMTLDPYCKDHKTYRVQNIYYDTIHNDLISKSISKPHFKQKLRARKYLGTDTCFLEIKKKNDGVVGKRRIRLTLEELNNFIEKRIIPVREDPTQKQIIGELQYFLKLYPVKPAVFISYERLGFFDINDKEFRITFDSQIHTKRNNFLFDQDDYQFSLLEDGYYILEIKSNKNFPMWLVRALSTMKIYSSSFSKYGTEYKKLLKGEINYENTRIHS